ncbi:hypothetical protein IFM89_003937 [Coptis chinensis]|uniref:F-box domain-containing protein n=1 Tax=Coptis chinensis TaxID=261450 RepID=A0A835HST8_9MAGN|nr:hypothetical protein IFM89_003937 [Coptis chinensis]
MSSSIRQSKRRKGVLPHEIIFEILSRLPVRTLGRFKCVCKSWFDLIRDPFFVDVHMNRAKENNDSLKYMVRLKGNRLYSNSSHPDDYRLQAVNHPFKTSHNEIQVCNSCNGLLCLISNAEKETICLWNPATGDYKVLPSSPTVDPPVWGRLHIEYGFGYCHSTNNYEVVKVVNYCDFDHYLVAYVYSLANGLWRRIQGGPCITGDGTSGVLVNESLNWIESHCSCNPRVVAFDIGGKEFRVVPQPGYGDCSFLEIGKLGGKLGLLRYDKWTGTYLEGWVMQDYGVGDSWTKLFIVNQGIYYFTALCDTMNNLINVSTDGRHVLSYDPKRGIMSYSECISFAGFSDARMYIESLVGFNNLQLQ